QIRYPTGIFQSSPRDRDGDIHADDYIEFTIESGEHVHQLALNPHGSLRDSRDGDVAWNAQVDSKSKRDLSNWTGELSIDLDSLGIKAGDTVRFNVVRSWKKYKSAMNTMFMDSASRPELVPLVLASSASAAVHTVGKPWDCVVAMEG